MAGPTRAESAGECPSFATVEQAKAACESASEYRDCAGVTARRSTGRVELRSSPVPVPVNASFQETSYVLGWPLRCKQLPLDPTWHQRAQVPAGW